MQEVAFMVPPPCFKWMTRIPHDHMPAMSQLPQEQCTNVCVCVFICNVVNCKNILCLLINFTLVK